jgi:general transcription factor 3C polypeptide 3 (transcription factor C subunit 4)
LRRIGDSAIASYHGGIASGDTAFLAGQAEIAVAKKHYESEIAHFRSNPDDFEDEIGWSEVVIYSELFTFDGKYDRALKELKSLARWLVGREVETFWDDVVGDDSEWDIDDSRRTAVSSFKIDAFPEECYGKGLPLELRVKLGIYRLRIGNEDEAMVGLFYASILVTRTSLIM